MQNLLDKAISYISPTWGAERATARVKTEMVSAFNETTGFHTPGSSNKAMRGWRVRGTSPDGDLLPKHKNQIAASRDLDMNTPIAGAILDRKTSGTIGFGLTLQSRIAREQLNISDEEADNWERKVEALFNIYAESKDVSLSRNMNFYEIQGLLFLSKLMNGDAFFMLPWKSEVGFPFETRVKAIEADLCSTPTSLQTDLSIKSGIKKDTYGAPISYFFSDQYDYDPTQSTSLPKWIEVPAFDRVSGRRNVYHIMDYRRIGQTRGVSILSKVFVILKQVSRLSEAKLMQNLIQTFYTVFVKSTSGPAIMPSGYGTEDSVLDGTGSQDSTSIEMGQANIIELDENQAIDVADPQRTDTGFDAFFNSLITQIGANVGIPRDTLMLHFQASYSAMRGEMLEFYRIAVADRKRFVLNFNQPVYEAWLEEQVIKGRVDAPGFLEDPIKRAYWCKAKWGGQGMGQIDPLKETKAAIEKMNAKLSSHEDEYNIIYGGDWEHTYERLVRENKLIEKLEPAKLPEEDKNATTNTDTNTEVEEKEEE